MFTAANLMLEQGLTIEEVDALTGQAIGWPRTGTFRLADLVGIDILAHVAANFPQGVTQGGFSGVLKEIVKRGWLGDKAGAPGDGSSSSGWKAGQGFYKKSRGADGKEERLVLDLATFEYRPSVKPALPALEMAKNAATVAERLRLLLANDPAKDKAAAFLWPFLASLWNFAAERIGEVAGDAASIDRAMRAGFNWELGPFEMWDAAGVASTVARMKALPTAGEPARRGSVGCRADFLVRERRAGVLPAGEGQAGAGCRRPRSRPGCGFPALARRGPLERGRVAGRSGRRHRLHRAALAQERHRRRCAGADLGGAESRLRCGARLCRVCDYRRPRELLALAPT
jgi:3-hydroxyacyl-CoA dehydrogenase